LTLFPHSFQFQTWQVFESVHKPQPPYLSKLLKNNISSCSC